MSPMSAPRRCARCGQLCRGKCPTCDNWRGKGNSKAYAKSTARASDKRWRKVRTRRLRDDPYCALCGAIADQVDHLDGTDYNDDSYHDRSWLNYDMTRSLCRSCHAKRTAAQGRRAQGMRG